MGERDVHPRRLSGAGTGHLGADAPGEQEPDRHLGGAGVLDGAGGMGDAFAGVVLGV